MGMDPAAATPVVPEYSGHEIDRFRHRVEGLRPVPAVDSDRFPYPGDDLGQQFIRVNGARAPCSRALGRGPAAGAYPGRDCRHCRAAKEGDLGTLSLGILYGLRAVVVGKRALVVGSCRFCIVMGLLLTVISPMGGICSLL